MEAAQLAGLLKRAERAEAKRAAFASLMQDVYAYALPERDGWNAYGYGADRHVKVYDSTAVVAAGRFANRLQQAMFPPQQKWATLTLPPELAAVPKADEVQKDLEAAANIVFAHIHASNFDLACNEWAQEVGAGVGAMLIENGRLGTKRSHAPLLRFLAVPAAHVAFDDGPFGTVEGVFFKQTMPARLVRRTYPDEAATWPREIVGKENEDTEAEITLLQATTFDAETEEWRMDVLHPETKTHCLSRKYRTNPWIITRWTRAPGETHGRGPLTQALPDIRTINKLMELTLISASFAVMGAWTAVDDGVINADTFKVQPGFAIPVRSNAGPNGPSLKALEFPGNYQLSEALREHLATRIRQVLFDDPLPPDLKANISATEIIERVKRFQADTGAFGRLHADSVVPTMLRCIDILEEAGMFAEERFAQLMETLQSSATRIRATSPLSQAQDHADVGAIMTFASQAGSLGEFGGAMLKAGVDPARAGKYAAEKMGVPHQLIPSTDETARADKEAAQAQETQTLATSPVMAQVAGAFANAATRPPEQQPAPSAQAPA